MKYKIGDVLIAKNDFFTTAGYKVFTTGKEYELKNITKVRWFFIDDKDDVRSLSTAYMEEIFGNRAIDLYDYAMEVL